MAVDLEKLIVQIEARTAQYERQLRKIEGDTGRSTRRMSKQFKGMNSAIAEGARMMKGFAATMLSVAGAQQIGRIFADVSKIQDVAEKVGLTTDQLQEYRFAAEQSGVATNTLDMAMQRFSRRVGEAANGAGELLPILKANDLALRNADGSMRSQNDILRDYINLIKNAGSDQERLVLAFKAFDSEGAALVNTFRDGTAALDEQIEGYRELGGVIDKEAIAKAKELDDQWNALTRTLGDQFKSGVITAIDWLQKLDAAIDRNIKKTANQIRTLLGFDAADFSGEADKLVSSVDRFIAGGGAKAGAVSRPSIVPNTKAEADASREAERRERELLRLKEEAERAALRAFERRQDVIEQLQFEAEQLGRTAEVQRVYNALQAAGVTLESADGQRIEALVMQNEHLARLKDAQDAYNDSLMSMAELGVSAFDRMISGGEKLTNVLKDMASQLASAATRALLLGQGPLAGLFGTSGAGGGLLSSLIPRSGGGPVSPRNAYQVGERGPELFVPQTAGKIIPNHAMRGGGAGVNIQVINQSSQQIDATQGERSPDGSFQRIYLRDAIRKEVPGGFKKAAPAFGVKPALARR